MEIVMTQDKVTKGAVRFTDQDSHNLYLRKEEVAKLGEPKHILVTVQPMTKS